jgi:hypothetical protein
MTLRVALIQARIKAVEGLIAAAQAEACQSCGLELLGYDAVVWLSCVAALNSERFPAGMSH